MVIPPQELKKVFEKWLSPQREHVWPNFNGGRNFFSPPVVSRNSVNLNISPRLEKAKKLRAKGKIKSLCGNFYSWTMSLGIVQKKGCFSFKLAWNNNYLVNIQLLLQS